LGRAMNQNALTWLGCSGSLAVMLLAVNPASANSIPDKQYDFIAPGAEESLPMDSSECSCSQDQINSTSIDIEGDLAIERSGCDCAGCRMAVRQLLQDGNLEIQ
jgi:hypothetical protein